MAAQQKLFEYAIVHHHRYVKPKEGEAERPAKSEIVVEPTLVMATDEQEVAILAARKIPEDLLTELDRVQVLVRPF